MLLGWFSDWFVIDVWSILGSKISQKSIKKTSQQHNNQKTKMLIKKNVVFYSIIVPSAMLCWVRKSITNDFLRLLFFGCCVVGMICWLFFDWFLDDFRVENRSQINQKSIRKAIENKMEVGMDFGWLLDRFLVDLGAKLGVKLGPSWHQNRRKWGTKTMSTNHQKSGAAGGRSGMQWYAGGPGSWPLIVL